MTLKVTQIENRFDIEISDCEIDIKLGSIITFPENIHIENIAAYNTYRQEVRNTSGSTLLANELSVASHALLRNLTFSKCGVNFLINNQGIGPIFERLLFLECRFNPDSFHYNGRNYRVDVDSSLTAEFYPNTDVRLRNSSLWLGANKVTCTSETLLNGNDTHLEVKSGSVKELQVSDGAFSITLNNEVQIKHIHTASNGFGMKDIISRGITILSQSGASTQFKDLKNPSYIKFTGSQLQINVESCDFTKTNIEFTNNSSVSFKSFSSIATTWNPKKIEYHGYSLKSKDYSIDISHAREFFCEMKTFFTNKGDSINAGKFYSAEMTSYLDLVSGGKKINLILKFWNWNLLFSKITSNFGQSWTWPLFFYILGSLLVYLIFSHLNNFDVSWNQFFNNNLYIKILSPIEIIKASYDELMVSCVKYSTLIQGLWLLWKILAAYLIFQTISAFRQYNRKF